MAVLAVSALGAAIGSALIPGTILGFSGAAIGWTLGGLLGSSLFPQKSQGPRLGDLRVPGTEYGQTIPFVQGNPRIAGQIIWASQKRETATTQSAGKGGGPEVTTYTYDIDLVIALSENPIQGVSRIWSNGELVYFGNTTRSGVWNGLTIYTGSDDQLPDPVYEAGVGAGNAPAYRGRGYVVIQGLQLGQSGQLPNLTFEVSTANFFGQLYNAPLNNVTEFNDIIEPPQPVFDEGGSYSFGASGITLVNTSLEQGGGPGLAFGFFQLGYTTENAKTSRAELDIQYYLSFDFAVAEKIFQAGNFNAGVTILFASIIPSGNFRIRAHLNNSGGLDLVYGFRGFDSIELGAIPESCNLSFVIKTAPPDTSREVDVFVNESYLSSFSVPAAGWYLQFGPEIQFIAPSLYTGVSAYRISNLIYGEGNPPSLNSSPLPINQAVQEVMLRAGYSADDFDVSGIQDYDKPMRALASAQVASSRSILEQLQGAFFFEVAKSDKMYFRKRPATAVASIPFSDLRAVQDFDSTEEPLALVKANDLEIASQASLTYPNMLGDYNIATEYSFRVNSAQESVSAVQSAIGMIPVEAKGVVDALLIEQVSGQTKAAIKVPLKYAYIEPGDIINVTNDDGRVYRFRVGAKRDDLTSIALELVLDDIGAIDFSAITSDDYILTETVRQLATTLWEVLDIPLLRDADDENGYYVAVAPDYTNGDEIWDGAVFVRKWATGDFESRFLSGDVCVLGTCTTILGDWRSGNVFDESNNVTVRVTGELSSTTRDNMLNDLTINICVIGNELVRFRSATFIQAVNGENEYKLTGLLRGQRGTEQYQVGHVVSERFVLLNTQIRNVIDQNSQIDLPSEVKAVTVNRLLSSVAAESFTNTAVRLKPFSVVQLRALADGSDLSVTWNRRTRRSYRYGGAVGTSVPLGEASEAYRLRIYDGATLVRTETVSTNSYTYTAADIAADGFAPSDVVRIEVAQISEIVGPGFPAEVEGVIP